MKTRRLWSWVYLKRLEAFVDNVTKFFEKKAIKLAEMRPDRIRKIWITWDPHFRAYENNTLTITKEYLHIQTP